MVGKDFFGVRPRIEPYRPWCRFILSCGVRIPLSFSQHCNRSDSRDCECIPSDFIEDAKTLSNQIE